MDLVKNNTLPLAAAIVLQSAGGTLFAAAFLADLGVPIEIALDLLARVDALHTDKLTLSPTHSLRPE